MEGMYLGSLPGERSRDIDLLLAKSQFLFLFICFVMLAMIMATRTMCPCLLKKMKWEKKTQKTDNRNRKQVCIKRTVAMLLKPTFQTPWRQTHLSKQ